MSVYCIVGANRGLGLEFVRQISALPGAVVLATTRPDADRADLEDALRGLASGSRAHVLDLDTANIRSIHKFAIRAARALEAVQAGSSGDAPNDAHAAPPPPKIDYLVVSAAINGGAPSQTSLSLDAGLLAAQVAVNVVGPAKVVEFLIDQQVLSPAARIVHLSSSLASLSLSRQMEPRLSVSYSLSKAALNMLAVHQAHDVRAHLPQAVVAVVDPGWVKTRMGGDDAPLEPPESVAGMLKVLHGLTEEDNATFYSHSGFKKPW